MKAVLGYINISQKCETILQDMLQILTALRRAKDMQLELETHVNEANFSKVRLVFWKLFFSRAF